MLFGDTLLSASAPAACPDRYRDRPVVFLGPSLGLDEARGILDADYRRPMRKGDVYRDLGSGGKTIAIIDGVFHCEPSVWPREILEAIDEGVEAFGARRMGPPRRRARRPRDVRVRDDSPLRFDFGAENPRLAACARCAPRSRLRPCRRGLRNPAEGERDGHQIAIDGQRV
jgi:hypothetical protein